METKKFTPNLEQIKERAKIVPFGKAAKYITKDPIPVEFKIYSTEREKPSEVTDNSTLYVVTPSLYKAPASENAYKFREISVKITNIPTSLTQKDLFDLLSKNARGLFLRCNLIFDRETRISRGYAYVTCENVEKAKELGKIVRMLVIDGFALTAEVLKD